MRSVGFCVLLVCPALLCGCQQAKTQSIQQAQAAEPAQSFGVTDVAGKTQPASGKAGKIAPAVLHPVTEVLVKVGDRVKKEHPLVRIDDDEPKADVRAKEA